MATQLSPDARTPQSALSLSVLYQTPGTRNLHRLHSPISHKSSSLPCPRNQAELGSNRLPEESRY